MKSSRGYTVKCRGLKLNRGPHDGQHWCNAVSFLWLYKSAFLPRANVVHFQCILNFRWGQFSVICFVFKPFVISLNNATVCHFRQAVGAKCAQVWRRYLTWRHISSSSLSRYCYTLQWMVDLVDARTFHFSSSDNFTSSHSLTHAHLLGLPWTRDGLDAETSNILKLTWRKQTAHLVWVLVMIM